MATPRASRTAVNLIRAGWARVALGPTRDVVIIEGPVEAIPIGTDTRLEDAHAQATGFDPRTLAEEYVYLQITPHEIQAWREANELEGRQLMRGGEWPVSSAVRQEDDSRASPARPACAPSTLGLGFSGHRAWRHRRKRLPSQRKKACTLSGHSYARARARSLRRGLVVSRRSVYVCGLRRLTSPTRSTNSARSLRLCCGKEGGG